MYPVSTQYKNQYLVREGFREDHGVRPPEIPSLWGLTQLVEHRSVKTLNPK